MKYFDDVFFGRSVRDIEDMATQLHDVPQVAGLTTRNVGNRTGRLKTACYFNKLIV